MPEPVVSVVMGTYNHAPFVAEAIGSVLAQDFADFEFLISDDGSTDRTAEIVAAQTDPRVHFSPNARNRGAALVLNELVSRARGRYVAVINSDDAWLPGKLAEQISILDNDPDVGAVFGRVNFFDRDGATIPKEELVFGEAFNKENRNCGAWLRYFFFHGNCLCHPTVLIRRELYDAAGPYDNRLRQLPDLDMWVRLVKHSRIFISPNNMINFRILPGANTSSDTYLNRVRTLNEHFFLALDFFSGVSADLLREGFADLLRLPEMPTESHVAIEKAFLFLHPVLSLTHVYQIVAMIKLRALLADSHCREILKKDYDFDDHSLHRLSAAADGWQSPAAIRPSDRCATSNVPTVELVQILLRRLSTRLRALLPT
jgi:glycosyltransferase involved in cell wall biosynthesis